MAGASNLVTGATGAQVEALIEAGISPRALVHDPISLGAQALAARGVELAGVTFDDCASLLNAMRGGRGVFSMQTRRADPSSMWSCAPAEI